MRNVRVAVKAVPDKLTIVRKLCSVIPGFCSYCGKFYVDVYSDRINLFCPIKQQGKMCPDGHEGYITENVLDGTIRHEIDNIKKEVS